MRPVRLHLTPVLLVALAVAAGGCSPDGAAPVLAEASPPPGVSGVALSYACASGHEIIVAYPDDASIRLTYLGQDYALVQATAATGARYVGADMDWSTAVGGGLDSAVLSRASADGSPGGIVLERCARPINEARPVAPVMPPEPVTDLPSAPPCKGPQLKLEGAGGDAAMGNRVAVVAVRNLGSAACGLAGYPSVSLVDDRNRPLATVRAETGPGSYFHSGQTLTPVILPPGGQAWFDVAWNVVPHEGEGETVCPTAARIRVTAPGDTSPVWLDRALTPCGGRIRVSPFRPVADPVPTAATPSGGEPAQP
ncbi:MAG: DUF4232 domain-containing protein [Brevundimonas sp.]